MPSGGSESQGNQDLTIVGYFLLESKGLFNFYGNDLAGSRLRRETKMNFFRFQRVFI